MVGGSFSRWPIMARSKSGRLKEGIDDDLHLKSQTERYIRSASSVRVMSAGSEAVTTIGWPVAG